MNRGVTRSVCLVLVLADDCPIGRGEVNKDKYVE